MKIYKLSKKVIFLIAIILLFQNCNTKKAEEYDKTQKIETEKTKVSIEVLKKANFNQEIFSNGVISSAQICDLVFKTGGQITKLYVKEGEFVKKGQLIAQLEISDKQRELKKAELRFAEAKNNLETILIGQGYEIKDSTNIPKEILKKAKIKSRWSLELINYQEALSNLKNSYIKAPFSGLAANIEKHKFDYVNSGDKICSLINNTEYNVIFTLFETEKNIITLNKKVEIQTLSDDTLFATVTQINPVVTKGQFRVSAKLFNTKNKILAGMSVKISVKNSIGNKISVQKDAVVTRQERDIVFTVENNLAKWNYVKTGKENMNRIVIKEGLKEGDSVIVSGNINIGHDNEVEIIKVR